MHVVADGQYDEAINSAELLEAPLPSHALPGPGETSSTTPSLHSGSHLQCAARPLPTAWPGWTRRITECTRRHSTVARAGARE